MTDCQMCGGCHEPGADCDRATREVVQKSVDLRRALKILAMTNGDRLILFGIAQLERHRSHGRGAKKELHAFDPEVEWFLEHIDDIAPELHRRGWVEHAPFTHTPGQVTVSTGNGDICALVVTELGRKQLNAAVVP